MIANAKIRPVKPNDLADLKAIIDGNDLFPSEMLDDMLSDYFNNESSNDYWLTYEDRNLLAISPEARRCAIAYYAPEQMTQGTWNLYLIAVHPNYQGKGIGTQIVDYIEQTLAVGGARILLVETSGLPSFEGTRSFYRQCGDREEARIREFYRVGEDKIIFRKSLQN